MSHVYNQPGSGIVGVYLDEQQARAEWAADPEAAAMGEAVKLLLKQIKERQPNAWRIFLANVTLEYLLDPK